MRQHHQALVAVDIVSLTPSGLKMTALNGPEDLDSGFKAGSKYKKKKYLIFKNLNLAKKNNALKIMSHNRLFIAL